MKKFKFLNLLTTLSLCTTICAINTPLQAFAQESPQVLDFIKARVGGEIILLSDLEKVLRLQTNQPVTIKPTGHTQNTQVTPEVVEQFLEYIISNKIVSLKAKELKLEANKEEVNRYIEMMAQMQNSNKETIINGLKQLDITEQDYINILKPEIEKRKITEMIVHGQITVSEEEINSVINSQQQNKTSEEKVVLKNLIIPSQIDSTINDTREEAIKKIEEELKNTKNISQLLSEYSNTYTNISGGQLDPLPLTSLPQELQQALTPTPAEGSIIGPISIGSSTFFFEFMSIQKEASTPLTAQQKEQLRNRIMESKIDVAMKDYITRHRGAFNIEVYPWK